MELQRVTSETITPEQLNLERLQIIVFRLGEEEYALEIDRVKEVVLTPNITKVPLLPAHIVGVANIRGKILAMVDLAKKFGMGKIITHLAQEISYSLVIESAVYQMAILVHQIPDTVSITEQEIDDSPNIIQEFSGNYIKGVIKQDERLIILLDIFKAMEEDIPHISNQEA